MRSVSQIYSEAVSTRNNYLQLTELNTGRSNSKLSMFNLLTYVVAVCIHTYEAVLDLFQVRIAEVLKGRINGTPDWYAMMAKKFQYNSVTESGDEPSRSVEPQRGAAHSFMPCKPQASLYDFVDLFRRIEKERVA